MSQDMATKVDELKKIVARKKERLQAIAELLHQVNIEEEKADKTTDEAKLAELEQQLAAL